MPGILYAQAPATLAVAMPTVKFIRHQAPHHPRRTPRGPCFWRVMRLTGHKATTLHEPDGLDHGKMPEPAFPLLLRRVQEANR